MVALVGAVVFSTGLAIDATLTVTLTETAEDISPGAVQALSALFANDYIPFAVGMQVLLLATGISVVKYGALPKWLGWVAIVLGVIALTPIGFVAFIGSILFVGIVSVLLAVRARRGTTVATA